MSPNPLLASSGLPRFHEIKPEHLKPALDQVLGWAEAELTRLEGLKTPSWESLLIPLDEIGERIHRVWSPISHLMGTCNSQDLRKVYEENRPRLVDFQLRLGQSEKLYSHYRALNSEKDKGSPLSISQKRALEDLIRSAELSGIGLPEDKRKEFLKISQRLSELSTEFSNHVLDANKAFSLDIRDSKKVEGLPESALTLAAQLFKEATGESASAKQGPWRFTLDHPSYGPVMQHCVDESLRKTLYEAQVSKASSGEFDNRSTLVEILNLRAQKAAILSYSSYASLSTKQKMAGTPEAALTLLEQLRIASWGPALSEKKTVDNFAKTFAKGKALEHWDYAFYSERLREKNFDYREEDLKPYFALPAVLEGLFDLAWRLFEVKVELNSDPGIQKWHKDVTFYKVSDKSGQLLANFFLDPFSRPAEKRGGAWMDDCLGRRRFAKELQKPVAYLVCNFTPPLGDKPSLLTFREVETLFHEFGHGLQHMLTTVEVPGVAGINGIEWDAVELPSQFMENWCYHEPTLNGLAKHYQTGEVLPSQLFHKIKAAKNFQSAMQMLRQLRFALTDLSLHLEAVPKTYDDVLRVAKEVAAKTSVTGIYHNDHTLCSFSHIFAGGYAAGYYSYKWAEVLSADAFAAFEEAGLDNPAALGAVGRRFRDSVLSLGGGLHPAEVYKKFRGRDPDIAALLRHSGLEKVG